MNGLLVLVLFDISLDCSEQVLADFFFFFSLCKGPDNKYFRSVGHMVSFASSQLCHCTVKAAIGDT